MVLGVKAHSAFFLISMDQYGMRSSNIADYLLGCQIRTKDSCFSCFSDDLRPR